VPPSGIVHCDDEPIDAGLRGDQRIGEVGRERGNAAVTRQVVTEDGKALDVVVNGLSVNG
jgi:hypothetical protein